MPLTSTSPWAVILAGGDGTRLLPLTERLTGDARPKQYCRLFGTQTLLDQTRSRAELIARPDRQVVVAARTHERYWGDLEGELFPGRLLAQPENRGTAPAIMLAALAVRRLSGDAPIAILPSDHDIADEAAFMDAVADAVTIVSAHPGALILLGIEPRSAEPDYGWIEPVLDSTYSVAPIHRFWEKPSPADARALLERGCLWNSFVMVGWASGFAQVIEAATPEIAAALNPAAPALGTAREASELQRAYADMPSLGFSECVLTPLARRFSVMRVKDVGWCDLGSPGRAVESARRRGQEPPWHVETSLTA